MLNNRCTTAGQVRTREMVSHCDVSVIVPVVSVQFKKCLWPMLGFHNFKIIGSQICEICENILLSF